MIQDISPIARAIAAGAILSAFVLAAPSQAASARKEVLLAQTTSTQMMPNSATTQLAPAQKSTTKHARHRMSHVDRVGARIKDLHDRLQITSAQETQWNMVAQTMRDNAKSIDAVSVDRTQKIKTMSAVDDLRSYETLSEAHADGMKKLVSAFAPLYDSMSDSQKKAADSLFRHRERHHQVTKQS
jgi:protein CpxP